MTITIITNATTICRAPKTNISNMSNIIKSVANIQLTRHIRSAIMAILITYDKHPLIIVCFYCYYKYNNRSLKKLFFAYVNNLPSTKFIQTIFLSPLHENLGIFTKQYKAVKSHYQIREKCIFDFHVDTNQIHIIDNPYSVCSLEIFLE
jgi:hypothetical protein